MSRFDVTDVNLEEVNVQVENTASRDTPRLDVEDAKVEGSEESRQAKINKLYPKKKEGNLALYENDLGTRPKISGLLSSLVSYDPVTPNPTTGPKRKRKKSAKMGTIMGVYLPTLQNILGVILFLRLTWIVGVAGIGESFLIIFLCCSCTFLTTISMSAIATNGVVPAGGSYFMISRNLGPEFGGAVGILFYLANTFGTSLYTLGAIEILLTYIAPQASLFGTISGNPSVLYNNMRVYGTILLLLMSIIVFVGVKLVNYFATFCLCCVIIAVISIYAGAFNPAMRAPICIVNGVALQGQLSCDFDPSNITNTTCHPNNTFLQDAFNDTFYNMRDGWEPESSPTCIDGIPGITVPQTFPDNGKSSYLRKGEASPEEPAAGIQISAAITSSFFILIGIFFPSVTGIMAGSNRSGDLRDAQKSIPVGTIAAQLTTTVIYVTCVLLFGGTISRPLLQDQFGDSTGSLVISLLAFPTKWIILIGALLSTIGAGLQTLTGAPRLLQAIANDNLIPFLKFFKWVSPWNNEPTVALIMTVLLAEVGVLIASLDYVAPILSMFYLMCYMFVNVACTLQSFLKSPNWRPRFRFYHWTTSLLGAALCLAIMFMSSWYYALVAMSLALIVYKYIEYRGAEKEWGDGMRGLSLQAARYSLLKLEEAPPHTKNWRPQLLVLVRLNSDLIPTHPKLLSFASQLKAGKGLTMVVSVLKGNFTEMVAETIAAKRTLKRFVSDNKVQGFCKVISSSRISDGLAYVVQGAGLGGMTHNTIMIAWPGAWRRTASWKLFIETIRVAASKNLAVLVPKGVDWFPSNEDRMKGHIDVWWIVHDGGLLMLLPFLLRQHKVWRHCKLRIFTVAQIEDNSLQMKKDLAAFLYQLRIEAEVYVIEMPDNEISAYTYERTLVMEQRNDLLKQMRLTRRESQQEVQLLISKSFIKRSTSLPAEKLDTLKESPTHVEGVADAGKAGSLQTPCRTPPRVEIERAHSPVDDNASTGSSVPEDLSVRTPLLELDPPNTMKTNASIKKYDQLFAVSEQRQEGDEHTAQTEEIPLGGTATSLVQIPMEENVRRMNTSVKLNEMIVTKSHNAALVIVNLPSPPQQEGDEENYMEFLDVLTEGLDRVLMVRGGGSEVVTIYS